MGLEEQTIEGLGETCEVCGARLTERELKTALESGGPMLCTIHAAEVVELSEEDAPAGGGAAGE
ncbi:hypothetical protein [Conexibacter arvalis]|uniref:Uncharacterized protein n=1 Tax=Conexibacter arvalis TaxID=912552 RepID=A0A840IJP9_9ACTN|nr:hypothetical protein [Conexibacter arvalis]MBB4664996.1 hypothetical protein [Conexibacter arvalis]